MLQFEKCNDCCVWMDAGVLSYKRCERNFDCEHCPLDSVLQAEIPDTVGEIAHNYEHISVAMPVSLNTDVSALLAPYASTVLQRDFSYTRDHIWVQALPGGYYRVGLDAYFLRLLPTATDIITLASGSEIAEGGPMGWVYIDGETHTMKSPVEGTIARRNSAISRVNSTMRATPYSESWLAVIKAENEQDPMPHYCNGATEASSRIRTQMDSFIQRAAEALEHPQHLGICMNDGGTRVESLEQALGSETYRDIVKEILTIGKT